MHGQNQEKHETPGELEELKAAVRKLSELSTQITNLASRKRRRSVGPLGGESKAGEDIDYRVQLFSEALVDFLVLRRRFRASYMAFQKSLKDLEGATDAKEISTLAGFTVLASHKEYRMLVDRMMENYEKTIIPAMSEIERAVKLAREVNEFGKWMGDISGYDHMTGDDDFTRMITAIRDRNIARFNEICETVLKKIESEQKE